MKKTSKCSTKIGNTASMEVKAATPTKSTKKPQVTKTGNDLRSK